MNEMSTELTTRTNELSTILASAGQAANEAARVSAFTDYRSRKASNTIAHQDTDLATFAAYLVQATGSDAITSDDLALDLESGALVGALKFDGSPADTICAKSGTYPYWVVVSEPYVLVYFGDTRELIALAP